MIGSLSGPNFTMRTAKMDRSRTDFIDFRQVQTFSLYVCMYICKTLFKHGKSSVEYYKLKTKTI